MPHSHRSGTPPRDGASASRTSGFSALRRSALQRFGVVAVPVVVLWIAVALALDVFK